MTNRVFHSITTLPGGEPAVNGRESRGQTETTSPSGRNNTTEQKEAQEPIPPVTDVSRYVSEHGEIDRFAVIMDLALPLAWHAFVLYRAAKASPDAMAKIFSMVADPSQSLVAIPSILNQAKEIIHAARSSR